MDKERVKQQIKGGLIVSCQALKEEPLHSSYIMARMAYAAMKGGASGIRANSKEDIIEIKKVVNLPVIGLVKRTYSDSALHITPTIKEVEELIEAGADIIATDATNRLRPYGKSLEIFFEEIRKRYPNQLFMADCSTFEEGVKAEVLGFDFVGTTLSGYTPYTKDRCLPDYEMMKKLAQTLKIPIIAEGGIWSPEELKEAMSCGVFAAVVGTAITRPMEITQKYVKVLEK